MEMAAVIMEMKMVMATVTLRMVGAVIGMMVKTGKVGAEAVVSGLAIQGSISASSAHASNVRASNATAATAARAARAA